MSTEPDPEETYPGAPHVEYSDDEGLLTEVETSHPDDDGIDESGGAGDSTASPYDEVIFDDSEAEVFYSSPGYRGVITHEGSTSTRRSNTRPGVTKEGKSPFRRTSALSGPAASFAAQSPGLAALSSTTTATPPITKQGRTASSSSLRTGEDRRTAIAGNLPGYISIDPNPEVKSYAYPWYARESQEEVTSNNALIEKAARRYGIDPNLLRAIVWIESTHGYYDAYTGILKAPKSVRPMNVNVDAWGPYLGVTRADLNKAEINIETGAFIFSQILERLIDPTPEKVFTLYNNLRADKVSGYGKTAAQYLRDRPWEK
jgi:hypothetical protein